MKKKIFALVAVGILAVTSTVVGVAAMDNISTGPMYELTDAIKAGDVCHEHLLQNCIDCEGYGLDASYAVYCSTCDIRMTRCCSGDCATDDNNANCLVSSHPSGCVNIQDLYWNAYICMQCGYYQRGSKIDDYHVESYWHTKDSTCFDHTYCGLDKLDDLRELFEDENRNEMMSIADNDVDTVKDPVAAGDYCEVHGIFACDIPHNDVE